MATYRGVIKKNDMEGGVWELHADDGERYQLRGGDDSLRVNDQKVEIDGKIDKGVMSFAMTGPILDVTSWKTV